MCVISSSGLIAGADALPGPGLDVPVDADGDGVSTYGDRYAFNYWLGAGGNLGNALFEAEVRKDGIIDVSKFFGAAGALLAPQSKAEEPESMEAEAFGVGDGGAAQASSSGCGTLAIIVAPFGAPTTPASVFSSCQSVFRYPTGAEVDPEQSLWCSRGPLTATNGVALLNLAQVPPMGLDGSIPLVGSDVPLAPPSVSEATGIGAEDIVVRTKPAFAKCEGDGTPSPYYSMSTWTNGQLICPVIKNTLGETCGTCGWIYNNFNDNKEPLAIDLVRAGMPGDFGAPEDVIFSDRDAGLARIRRSFTPGPAVCYALYDTTTLFAFTDTVRVWGLALGNFKGAGVFGVYFVDQPFFGPRTIRRLVKQGSSYSNQAFATLPDGQFAARSLAFDPVSGDLFVSADSSPGRIWRINASGTVRLFGQSFRKPNGIAFHPSGVMLVVEESVSEPTKGNVLAVGGWRNLFKRGDANGDGTVNISDPITISNWLSPTIKGPVPQCLDGADSNDDSSVLQNDADLIPKQANAATMK